MDDVDAAFERAVTQGWMSAQQYRYLVDYFHTTRQGSLLVFGTGYDSPLWSVCFGDRVVFVEDDPNYLTLAPAGSRVILQQYASRVGTWAPVAAPPPLISTPWDNVLVDGPKGFASHCPGRQFPIAWASELAQHRVFVHDYQRDWERLVCSRYLGHPTDIVTSKKHGDLAVFEKEPDGN